MDAGGEEDEEIEEVEEDEEDEENEEVEFIGRVRHVQVGHLMLRAQTRAWLSALVIDRGAGASVDRVGPVAGSTGAARQERVGAQQHQGKVPRRRAPFCCPPGLRLGTQAGC